MHFLNQITYELPFVHDKLPRKLRNWWKVTLCPVMYF